MKIQHTSATNHQSNEVNNSIILQLFCHQSYFVLLRYLITSPEWNFTILKLNQNIDSAKAYEAYYIEEEKIINSSLEDVVAIPRFIVVMFKLYSQIHITSVIEWFFDPLNFNNLMPSDLRPLLNYSIFNRIFLIFCLQKFLFSKFGVIKIFPCAEKKKKSSVREDMRGIKNQFNLKLVFITFAGFFNRKEKLLRVSNTSAMKKKLLSGTSWE